MEFGVRPHLLRGRVKHLYGPTRIDYAPDELLVITVVRNGPDLDLWKRERVEVHLDGWRCYLVPL